MTDGRKVALVTGGARGIGRVIAADLARDYDLAITYNRTAPQALPEGALAVAAELSEPEAPARVVEAVIERFGRLDVIVNNAGVIGMSAAEDYAQEILRTMLDVNVLAPHGILAAALPYLGEGAAIVNISSVNAILPPKGAAIYGASKAALDLWTRAMAKELGPRGIRVNAVAPGAVNIAEEPRDAELTQIFVEMTALGRLATAQDIAEAVRFLAGQAAGSITGEVLTVSGGYRL
ncbi:putative 3-oxoacyl-(Acyl-carrier-protein) reductase [Sulfitobacter noctilucae]|uniref:SDR family NAD(P)-dependent oxidoreductase n=1 Tax=Sulfitobacter noctilucae TaxID=1342302 RepID=UPI0004680AFA|nr:SDR family oxidoreductase [Sulfitobacter noctilucae]KIN61448.1 putative 3-oxoacyl-(Acyl-carrier-protein) reductase [Sulfitobacter noctilucae]